MKSNSQQLVYELLSDNGATYAEIADELNITKSTARDHVSSLRDSEDGICSQATRSGEKRIFTMDSTTSHPTNNNPKNSEEKRNKRGKTERLNKYLNGMERRLTDMLDRTKPPVADGGHSLRDQHEDVVIHRTDTHIGDVVTNEFGETVYDTEIAVNREEYVTSQVMELVERQQQAGVTFDTAHLLLGGDHVTGEQIYANQQAHIEETLDSQIEIAAETFLEQIQRLADFFPSVQVVCQVGNHGALDASYSNGANADRIVYMMLDQAVRRDSGLDNVTLIRNSSTNFTNFFVRGDKESYKRRNKGYKFHLRHGEDSLEHIGTSAGKNRWRGWQIKHGFDQAYRGHYHSFRIEAITGNRNVFMTGSPKPPGGFEERLSEWTQPTATVHGVSDKRPTTFMYPIEFGDTLDE